jgi:predicted phosphodiesterase
MKIAIFSDIHGNLAALQTLLGHLASGGFDALYCLGDLFTPYPGSPQIWELVKSARVQCVQGNNEAALLAHLTGQSDYRSDDEVRFRPFLKNAAELAPLLDELLAIPLYRSVPLTEKLHLHLCHYSPNEVLLGLHSSLNNLDEYVARVPEQVVLTGHTHTFTARDIQGKQVYTVGSAGLPIKGSHQLEYVIVQDLHGEFSISYQLLPYPYEQQVAWLLQQRFLQDFGPVAWLAFDEILTQRDRIFRFFNDYLPAHAAAPLDHYRLVEEFLRSIGRWETLKQYFDR